MSDHSIEREPHLRGPSRLDDCDRLDEEPARASAVPDEGVADDGGRSVSDEPALLWAGLDDEQHRGFRAHLAERIAATPAWLKWLTIMGMALVAGPFAVFGAFFKAAAGEGGWGYMAVVVVGPVLEEMLKIAAILWIVERKPWLVPMAGNGVAILIVGLVGGLAFAAIENWVYLNIYFPDPSGELVMWRWTVGPALHMGCSFLAAMGVARMWRRTMAEGKPAEVAIAFPWLVTAMIVHGAYNAFAVLLAILNLGP